MKLDCWLTDRTLFTKPNSKWITDLNIKYRTIKLTEDNIENLHDLGYGDDFLYTAPKAQLTKEKLISWTSLKLKTSALPKALSGA